MIFLFIAVLSLADAPRAPKHAIQNCILSKSHIILEKENDRGGWKNTLIYGRL